MRRERLIAVLAQSLEPDAALTAAEAVMREFGGALEWVPSLGRQSRAERNEAIRRLYRSGVTIPDLAERYGLNERTIRRVVGD